MAGPMPIWSVPEAKSKCAPDPERRFKLQAYALSLRQFAGRIIDVDLELADLAGRLRAFERSAGRVLGEPDAVIAATAVIKGCILVTRNVRDFETLSIPLLNPWEDVV